MDEFFADEHDAFILLNREDMAAMIGIAVETASRMIAQFKRQKILYRYKENRFRCNVAALQQITRYG
jgi:CRP/FNR family transcriptional regulator